MNPSDLHFYEEFRQRAPWAGRLCFAAGILAAFVLCLGALSWRAPTEFPAGSYLTIPKGTSFSRTAILLEERKVIRSPLWFKFFGALFGGTGSIKAGDYYFTKALSLPRVAWRVTRGIYETERISVMIPEGMNIQEIAAKLRRALPHFDATQFLAFAKEKEGTLFPDTYFFLPDAGAEQVILAMEQNFAKRVALLQKQITQFRRPLADVIIMASLLEEEARTEETRQKIAGILWKRLDAGMLLQVDAVFPYIFGEMPYNLTDGDLLVDSPYNTYKYKGLPPGPITNPGLDAIRAAITPITTPDWFYLSDKDGEMHYAKTHEEHLLNREKYLNQ